MATESRKFYFDYLGRFQGEIFFAKSSTKNEKTTAKTTAELI